MLSRRAFFGAIGAAAGSLWLPYEPRRVYSFASELRPGEATIGDIRLRNTVPIFARNHGVDIRNLEVRPVGIRIVEVVA